MTTLELPLVQQARAHQDRVAVIDTDGSYTYQQLIDASASFASQLLNHYPEPKRDLQEARIVFIVPRTYEYIRVQWGIWRAGGIAVPLCELHPPPEWRYIIEDTEASMIIAHPDYASRIESTASDLGLPLLLTTEFSATESSALPSLDPERRAMILYTSGTTGKPKGVVSTHQNLQAQICTLVWAWGWTQDDHILHVLPLHHVHGIVNVLSCALWVGATCQILPKFDASWVWQTFQSESLTLFMAVPTIYARLISAWEKASREEQEAMSAACRKFRLMVSGSAALPVPVLQKWQNISSHILLERYGMTEIGMALSNPLHGPRQAGYVGTPLPGITIRRVDEAGQPVSPEIAGEIQVQGPTVFREYWQKPEATQASFDGNWFRTGDMAVEEAGKFRILGRNSVDIIKTGGYKVSALEIEAALRDHAAILDCAVVGIDDPDWGERICTALTLRDDASLSLTDLRTWAKERLAPYKIPSRLIIMEDLPRNTLGKVTKPAVKELFRAQD